MTRALICLSDVCNQLTLFNHLNKNLLEEHKFQPNPYFYGKLRDRNTDLVLHKNDSDKTVWADFRAWAYQKIAEVSKRREHCNFELAKVGMFSKLGRKIILGVACLSKRNIKF